MFRSNRDIDVYLREWRDLSDRSRQETIDALDTENLILLEQYVKREYLFEKQTRYWEMLKAQLPGIRSGVVAWRRRLEDRLYGKMLTLDTISRRKEYEESLEQLNRKRIVILQEVLRRRSEIDGIWKELVANLLFTRELGRRMTWLRDACDELETYLKDDLYAPGCIWGDESRNEVKAACRADSDDPAEEECVTSENPISWIEAMVRMSQILMQLTFYSNMEAKEPEEVLGMLLLMSVFDHRGSANWFIANGFREDQIPSMEEWKSVVDPQLPHYQQLLSGQILRRAFVKKLFSMENQDPETWPDEIADPFWSQGMWGDEEFLAEGDYSVGLGEDSPILERKRGPRLVK